MTLSSGTNIEPRFPDLNFDIREDDRYADFLSGVQEHFDALVRTSPSLFHTNVDPAVLWETYLANAPPGARQSRNCHCCRAFIERFGGLVSIAEDGTITSAVWPKKAPVAYAAAVAALRMRVEHAEVTGVFRASEATWGVPRTGLWTHISLVPPASIRSTSPLATPHQEMAVKVEEFNMLERSLAEYPIRIVRQAEALLTNGSLPRAEKCVGVAQWLLRLHERLATTKARIARRAILWLAVAKAPPGYCHVRSGMIGTLLDDLVAGLPFETIERKWTEKMDPLQYMRPQAPPAEGNIAAAEKIVAALRSAGALERRFARLADVRALWVPDHSRAREALARPTTGAFGHLTPRSTRQPAPYDAPPVTMTWSKFRTTVLPTAEEIEFLVPHGRQPYTAMVTAKNPHAPNLLQWDNPVSHYVYVNGSPPEHWGLVAGRHHRVTAVVLRPWMWDETRPPMAHHGNGVLFALEGCRDRQYSSSGGMFPEQIRSEYHGVRRTLEAHFKSAVIEDRLSAEVCGISLVQGPGTWGRTFRVTSNGIRTPYILDRWD